MAVESSINVTCDHCGLKASLNDVRKRNSRWLHVTPHSMEGPPMGAIGKPQMYAKDFCSERCVSGYGAIHILDIVLDKDAL